jgi:hypothetical protein
MRITRDTHTGKRFRWNITATWPSVGNLCGPARCTSRTATELHPTRVPLALLTELNPGVDVEAKLREHRERAVQ